MQEIPDNELDDLFRKSLNTPKIPFDEKAWDAMEEKLDAEDRKGAFYWKTVGGSIALLILTTLGIYYINTKTITLKTVNQSQNSSTNSAYIDKSKELDNPNKIVEAKSRDNINPKGMPAIKTKNRNIAILNEKKDATSYQGATIVTKHKREQSKDDINSKPLSLESKTRNQDVRPENKESKNSKKINFVKKQSSNPDTKEAIDNNDISNVRNKEKTNSIAGTTSLKSSNTKRNIGIQSSLAKDAIFSTSNAINDPGSKKIEERKAVNNKNKVETNPGSASENIPLTPVDNSAIKETAYTKKETIEDSTKKDTTEPVIIASAPTSQKKDSAVSKLKNKKLLSINLLMNPEFSTSPSFTMYKPGYNMGLMVEYYISKRISIMAGGLYSRKIYTAEGYEYKPENNWWPRNTAPSTIKATCNVVEIPVFLRYKFVNKENYNIYVTTGLLSYLMLRESYNYIYSPGTNTTGLLTSKEVVNQNRYFFGVYNLSLGIEKRINANWSVQAEPYMQIPLTGVGEGKIKLISSGVYFTLKHYFRF